MRAWRFILGVTAIALVPVARADDCHNAPDQARMNECFYKSYKRADAELNLLYQQMIGRLKEGGADWADTHTALVTAQRAWIAFRDADVNYSARGLMEASTQQSLLLV